MGLSTKQVSVDHRTPDLLQSPEFPKSPSTRPRQNHHQHAEPLNCPRCNSTNTKFCYYNNYNKSQPRHFCKACKRHWTKGGTLRNVPVGGGRKNKRHKSSHASTTTSAAAAASTSQNLAEFSSKLSDSLYQTIIHQPYDNNSIFNIASWPPINVQNQTSQFSFSSLSSNSDTNPSSNIGNSFQSLIGYKYNIEKPETLMEESIVTSILPPNDGVCHQSWEVLESPITSTSLSVMELPNSYWNWSELDTTIGSDLNIPWNEELEIKP